MSSNRNDARQAFTEVVAVEAWHSPFGSEARIVDLCVDVVFGTARLGDEADSPVRFRLGIRQADIVVVVPDVEPVSVDPASVSRDAPSFSGLATARRAEKRSGSLTAKIFAGFRGGGAIGGRIGASAAQRKSRSSEVKLAAEIRSMSVTQARSDDGHYRWTVVPEIGEALAGRPWSATDEPRMKLTDRRPETSTSIPPSVRVEVRCRREDLVVSDITLKDESLWAALKGRSGFRNRLAAAESLIRDRLLEDGLQVSDMDELFSRLTLASVNAMPVETA